MVDGRDDTRTSVDFFLPSKSDLDSRTIERSTPADPRIEVLIDRIEWNTEGASAPLAIDLPAFFASVLDN